MWTKSGGINSTTTAPTIICKVLGSFGGHFYELRTAEAIAGYKLEQLCKLLEGWVPDTDLLKEFSKVLADELAIGKNRISANTKKKIEQFGKTVDKWLCHYKELPLPSGQNGRSVDENNSYELEPIIKELIDLLEEAWNKAYLLLPGKNIVLRDPQELLTDARGALKKVFPCREKVIRANVDLLEKNRIYPLYNFLKNRNKLYRHLDGIVADADEQRPLDLLTAIPGQPGIAV